MVLRVASPLLVFPTTTFTSTASLSMTRHFFSINLLRYQYTLTTVNKYPRPIRRINHPQIQSSNLIKRRKYKYRSLPRVNSMDNVDTMEMKLDLLYSGYRPLPIVESTPKETVMGSGTTVYEISLDLTDLLKQSNTGKGVAGIWKQSATGLVDYTGDWAGVPYEVVETLKPFVPPSELAEPVKINSKKDNLVGKIYQMIDNINKKRGRKRPLVSLLQQKKKIE